MLELRYTLALVTGGGDGLGRELAVALSRRGAAVLVADPDLDAARGTVALVERARVRGWAHQADLADEHDVRLLAARARDLGGADLLVDVVGAPALLDELFLTGLEHRTGLRRHPGAGVRVPPGARPTEVTATCRAVLDALSARPAGRVVALASTTS